MCTSSGYREGDGRGRRSGILALEIERGGVVGAPPASVFEGVEEDAEGDDGCGVFASKAWKVTGFEKGSGRGRLRCREQAWGRVVLLE